jgi:hypothetical protein
MAQKQVLRLEPTPRFEQIAGTLPLQRELHVIVNAIRHQFCQRV